MNRLERMRACMAEQNIADFYCRDLSNVKWLTGFEGVFDDEDAHLAFITPKSAVLHTDSRYARAAAQAARGTCWRVDARGGSHADWAANAFAAFHEAAGTPAGFDVCAFGVETSMTLGEYRALESAFSDKQWHPAFAETTDFVRGLRAVKDEREIEAMRAAQAITDEAFLEIVDFMQAGMTELQVKMHLEDTMRRMGAEGLAFDSIVATGENGASPHCIAGETRLRAGDMVVLDFGARKGGYCSDMTRTVCVEYASERAMDVFDAVRAANEAVEEALKPGMTGAAAHAMAEESLLASGFGGKMGHGLGHGVGIDIHELPNLSPRNTKPLEVGNVVTVEPGVYLSGELGCRLEDFGVITEDGFEPFTRSTHELVIVG